MKWLILILLVSCNDNYAESKQAKKDYEQKVLVIDLDNQRRQCLLMDSIINSKK